MQNWQKLKSDYLPSILFYYLALILIPLFSRILLTLIYAERLSGISLLSLLSNGLHTDSVTASFLTLPLVIMLAISPRFGGKACQRLILVYIAASITFFVYLETCTYNFIGQYDVRPNRVFYEYLVYPREILPMLIKMAPFSMLLILTEVLTLPILIWRLSSKTVMGGLNVFQPIRLAGLAFLLPWLLIGARGSVTPRPFNISSVSFSENRLANELALNSGYSLVYSVYRERLELDAEKFYGKIDYPQSLLLLRHRVGLPESSIANSAGPFAREQQPEQKIDKVRNVVIFLQESLGAEYVGHLGGLPLTPNFDELATQGLSFTQMYSTGTRTVRGIEAVLASFSQIPGSSVVKREKSKTDFFTVAQLFKDQGCSTEFVYGGRSNFDEMKSFMVGNGINDFYDQPTFKNPVFTNEWGVSDEDLVRKANDVFRSHGEKCFFSLILSTSSHSPFEFPDGRIELYEKPKNTFNNAVKYADFAIGELFRLAKKEKYFENTLFVVIADHSTRVFGDEFVPVKKFHIPAVITGPGVPKIKYNLPASQIDIIPTILNFSGMTTSHPSMGRNIFSVSKKDKGRAILQYYNNFAYIVGEEAIILKPNEEPLYFTVNNFKLVPSIRKFDFLEEARSAAVVPWHIYNEKLHTAKVNNYPK